MVFFYGNFTMTGDKWDVFSGTSWVPGVGPKTPEIWWFVMVYPLVMTNTVIENGPVEIVDLQKVVIFQFAKRTSLPEGKTSGFPWIKTCVFWQNATRHSDEMTFALKNGRSSGRIFPTNQNQPASGKSTILSFSYWCFSDMNIFRESKSSNPNFRRMHAFILKITHIG